MRDKYNLNTLPAGMQDADGDIATHGGADTASAASAVPSVQSIIPGMAPEDRVAPSFHKVSPNSGLRELTCVRFSFCLWSTK